jgi:hypothetical protein
VKTSAIHQAPASADVDEITPIERALVAALTRAIVAEIRSETESPATPPRPAVDTRLTDR